MNVYRIAPKVILDCLFYHMPILLETPSLILTCTESLVFTAQKWPSRFEAIYIHYYYTNPEIVPIPPRSFKLIGYWLFYQQTCTIKR